MEHPLTGTFEKLDRADQSIKNLESEIARFLEISDHQVIPNDDDQSFHQAIDHHGKREIPKRFSILAGEIVHHLRSALDHVVWQLSRPAIRQTAPRSIEFPIFEVKPVTKNNISRYERKVKGITSPTARDIIEKLQPYNRSPEPLNDPLWIVQELDVIDKHRELVMIFPAFTLNLPPELRKFAVLYKKGELKTAKIGADLANTLKQNSKVTRQISFKEFGKWENQPVIPALSHLAKYVRGVVKVFTHEFK